MKRAILLGLLLALGAGGEGLRALEHSSQDAVSGPPGEQRNSSLKPSYLFNMRGRRDPFVDVNVLRGAGAGIFNISALEFKGMIEVQGQVTALFVAASDRASYSLRGNRLYGADDKAVPGVIGRFMGPKEVRLRQGELTLNFSALRAAKRKI